MESGSAQGCMVGGQEATVIDWSKKVSDWINEKTFSVWSSQVLEGLPREVVRSPSMDVFKTWLAKSPELPVCSEQKVDWKPAKVLSNLNDSLILHNFPHMILYCIPYHLICSLLVDEILFTHHFFLISSFYLYLFYSAVPFYLQVCLIVPLQLDHGVFWVLLASKVSSMPLNPQSNLTSRYIYGDSSWPSSPSALLSELSCRGFVFCFTAVLLFLISSNGWRTLICSLKDSYGTVFSFHKRRK